MAGSAEEDNPIFETGFAAHTRHFLLRKPNPVLGSDPQIHSCSVSYHPLANKHVTKVVTLGCEQVVPHAMIRRSIFCHNVYWASDTMRQSSCGFEGLTPTRGLVWAAGSGMCIVRGKARHRILDRLPLQNQPQMEVALNTSLDTYRTVCPSQMKKLFLRFDNGL